MAGRQHELPSRDAEGASVTVQIDLTGRAALVIGGGLANTLDRARFGAVRDFIRTPWAIVNVADLCVVAGVVLLSVLGVMRLARGRTDTVPSDAHHGFEAA